MSIGEKLIDHFFPDPSKKAEALLELQKLQQNGDLAVMTAQSGINQIEASNPNMFVSGWRPFVGWICAVGFAVQFIVGPTLSWLAGLLGHPIPFPTLDTGSLVALLTGMLGLSGMRSFEKFTGVQNDH
jgi:hypothetical protein